MIQNDLFAASQAAAPALNPAHANDAGRGFHSFAPTSTETTGKRRIGQKAGVAQSGEHRSVEPKAAGSKPAARAKSPLAAAHAAGAAGMRQAVDHAERDIENWGDLALQWIWQYARTHSLFTPEDCAAASVKWGLIQPADGRAWGAPYRRAVGLGYVERSDMKYRRVHGHGSIGVKWRSKVCG